MIFEDDFFYDDEGFSEIETFDAFMEVVKSHTERQTPSQIENYINDCKAFFRSVYNLGIEDGFLLAIESKENVDQLKDNTKKK
jgi:hypothetical protein